MSKKHTVSGAASLTILATASSAWGTPANDKINLGFIGCGGRGLSLIVDFLKIPGINIVACSDTRARNLKWGCGYGIRAGHKVKAVPDCRNMFDDKDIDAIVCATPDHWHALLAIAACQAQKDLYIEKPLALSIEESKKIMEAAAKYNRVVQHGTQSRSAEYLKQAKKYIESGKLGKIHFARVYNMKQWDNFQFGPDEAPEGIDWNLWNGPAPEKAYNPAYIKQWHHLWDYSSGDMINDGIHQLDICRWLIGKDYPKSVFSQGGRYNTTGGSQTPDTQTALFEFDDLILAFELTLYTPYMLKIDKEVRENDMFPYWPQCTTRIELYGEAGMMLVGRLGGGWQVFVRPKSRKPVVRDFCYGRFPDRVHKENFLDCIRNRSRTNAPVDEAYKSVLLAQLATISLRLGGQKLNVDPSTGQVLDIPEDAPGYKRTYRKPFVLPETV